MLEGYLTQRVNKDALGHPPGSGSGGWVGRNTRAHTLRGPGVENRLGTGSRSYMDLAAAQQATVKRKGLSVGLVRRKV